MKKLLYFIAALSASAFGADVTDDIWGYDGSYWRARTLTEASIPLETHDHDGTPTAQITHANTTGQTSSDHHTATVNTDAESKCLSNESLRGDGACTAPIDASNEVTHDSTVGVGTNNHHIPTVDTFVTNKDTHNHEGGDGAAISHEDLTTIATGQHHVQTIAADISHDNITGVSISDHHVATVDTFVTNLDAHDHVGGDGDPIGMAAFDTDTGDAFSMINSSALDSPAITVTSNGTVVSLNLEKSGTGDIRFVFSDGVHIHDTTPIEAVTLTAGSDVSPQINYVYILQSDKTLTVSTSGFPATEYAPIAVTLVQSAASVQTYGAYKVHAWTDHLSANSGQGHLADINYWIRHQPATWTSGVATTATGGASTYDIATASGEVLQLHQHSFPAFDTATGSDVYVVNDSVTAYKRLGDLTTATLDSTGTTMAGNWYTIVYWGAVSESSGDSKIYANLPSGSYNNNNGGKAVNDDEGFNIYTIPSDFSGVGFLISEVTVSESGGAFTIQDTQDLRGQSPSVSPGGGAVGGNEFVDNVFRIQDDGDVTKQIAFQASGITTGTTRNLTVQDSDGTLAYLSDITGGGASVTTSTTPPLSPSDGDLWWNTEDLNGYVYHNDGTTGVWVDFTSPLSAIAKPEQTVGISVRRTSNQAISASTHTIVLHDTELWDYGNDYDTATGIFTVPAGKEGKYLITSAIGFDIAVDQQQAICYIFNGGTNLIWNVLRASGVAEQSTTCVGIFDLTAGDTITSKAFVTSADNISGTSSGRETYMDIEYLEEEVVVARTDLKETVQLLPNPRFEVVQDGTSFPAFTGGGYVLDTWRYSESGTAIVTVTQDTDTPTVAQAGKLIEHSLKIDTTTIDSSIAASEYVRLSGYIEGYDFQKIAQQDFDISFWHKHTKTGTYTVGLRNTAGDRSYVAEYTQSTTNTWEQATLNIVASPSAGTWDYANGQGIELIWTLAGGTTYQTTADTWQTGNYFLTSNQVNGVDSTANNFMLADIQINSDSVMQGYSNYEAELAHVQRYFTALPLNEMPSSVWSAVSNFQTTGKLEFLTAMRAAPTLSLTNVYWYSNSTGWTASSGGSYATNPNTTATNIILKGAGSATLYQSIIFRFNADLDARF